MEKHKSFGEKAVGLSFNPGGSEQVTAIKTQYAYAIDFLDGLRKASSDPEVQRMYSIAITETQTAQMWAVKAVTWNIV
jgi:hypothetical protein